MVEPWVYKCEKCEWSGHLKDMICRAVPGKYEKYLCPDCGEVVLNFYIGDKDEDI